MIKMTIKRYFSIFPYLSFNSRSWNMSQMYDTLPVWPVQEFWVKPKHSKSHCIHLFLLFEHPNTSPHQIIHSTVVSTRQALTASVNSNSFSPLFVSFFLIVLSTSFSVCFNMNISYSSIPLADFSSLRSFLSFFYFSTSIFFFFSNSSLLFFT